MADDNKPKKDRSPSFPFIPLKEAVKRLQAFDQTFGRHPAPANKVGIAWGMKEGSSQAFQTLAALKAFGLIKYEGSAKTLTASLTDDARTYLRAQQESIKNEVVRRVATKPAQIAKFWNMWGSDRPPDAVCLDQLILSHSFTDSAARNFLKVYDDTIAYAGLATSDKVEDEIGAGDAGDIDNVSDRRPPPEEPLRPPPPPLPPGKAKLMANERELTTGMLAKDASFRLIVTGAIGVKEIERLIKKLELDKEILADEDRSTDEIEDASAGE